MGAPPQVPRWIGDLSELMGLQLQGNRLSGTIPAELGKLAKLAVLYLNDNELEGTVRGVPPSRAPRALPPRPRRLTRAGPDRQVPPELAQLKQLTKLHLQNNRIAGLPPWMTQLTALRELHLAGNAPDRGRETFV